MTAARRAVPDSYLINKKSSGYRQNPHGWTVRKPGLFFIWQPHQSRLVTKRHQLTVLVSHALLGFIPLLTGFIKDRLSHFCITECKVIICLTCGHTFLPAQHSSQSDNRRYLSSSGSSSVRPVISRMRPRR